jgi:all-trans-retinol 13,14-reductase
MDDLLWGFAPWVGFLLVNRFANLYVAGAAGLLIALVVFGRAYSRHRIHLFEVAGVVFFAGLLVVVGAVRPSDIASWARYAQAVAHGTLTLIVFGSVLVGKPFTEPYAREQTPESAWNSPGFHQANVKISLLWGCAFLVGTISLIIAGVTDDRPFLLRIVVPFGALLLALMYSTRQREDSSPAS